MAADAAGFLYAADASAVSRAGSRVHLVLAGRQISLMCVPERNCHAGAAPPCVAALLRRTRRRHGTRLHAMDTICYHAGGPLTHGDIEDVKCACALRSLTRRACRSLHPLGAPRAAAALASSAPGTRIGCAVAPSPRPSLQPPPPQPPRAQVTLDTGEKLYRATELNPEVCLRCGRADDTVCVQHSRTRRTGYAPSLKHAARNTTDAQVGTRRLALGGGAATRARGGGARRCHLCAHRHRAA